MRRVVHGPNANSRFAARLAVRSLAGLVVGVAAVGAAWGLDRLVGARVPLAPQTAQALLGTLIGSVVTIAVFALWMRTVVVGLASGQVSARVLSAYLDDHFQQRVLGVMVGLFVYLVGAAALLPTQGRESPAVLVTLAVLVVVAALIGILLAMRDAVASLALPSVVRTLTDGVVALLEQPPEPNDTPPCPPGGQFDTRAVVASRDLGWVQSIDYEALLDALRPGEIVDLQVDVGDFVAGGEPLCHLDATVDDDTEADIRDAFRLSRVRSTEHDLSYAIQQLVDVAESAMAPHSSDTSTAYEALVHLRAVLHVLIRRGTASCCLEGEEGRWVVSSAAWSTVDHLEEVFGRLKAAVDDPSFDRQVRHTIDALIRTAEEVGDDASTAALRRLRDPRAVAAGPQPSPEDRGGDS